MKRICIFVIVALFTFTIAYIFISENTVIDKDSIVRYLDDKDFNNIKFEDFMMKAIKKPLVYSYDNYKIYKFVLGLKHNQEIRTLTCYITRESSWGNKRYRILYNKDNDYFNILEEKKSTGDTKKMKAKEFFAVLDSFKDNIVFPEGQYNYYQIRLIGTSEIQITTSNDSETYIWENGQLRPRLENEKTFGITLFVFGEPIGEIDKPMFYIIPK